MAGFSEWKDNTLKGLIGLVVVGGSSWCGWVTAMTNAAVNQAEVREIIKTDSPYREDRKMLETQINSMSAVVKNNTEAINALRVEIERLSRED